jgi:ribonucleoside-diphosphate reductase alpha chain
MSERRRLADRRESELLTFQAMGLNFVASVGRYADGEIGEVFIDNHKAGSNVGTLVRDLAITFSFAVQHGARVSDIQRALGRDSEGRPLGPLAVLLDLLLTNGSVS